MAALWPLSLNPQIDANGDPLVGAQVFFWNTGTEDAQTTYADYGLSTESSHDGDGAVVTDANGRWPAIFLTPTPGTYRMRALDPDGVVLFDVDGVPVPQNADASPPDAGGTDPTLLARTGDIKARHDTGAHSGWVRAAGRSIGSAVSGASERADDDTQDLYLQLYDADTTLAVSGGRGASGIADWNANKTLALPDYRARGLVGLADMGNTSSTLLAGVTVDNSETVTTLGATLGEGTHALIIAELAAHDHGAATGSAGAYDPKNGSYDRLLKHDGTSTIDLVDSTDTSGTEPNLKSSAVATAQAAHTHTIASSGAGDGHNNVQPSALVTFYLKL